MKEPKPLFITTYLLAILILLSACSKGNRYFISPVGSDENNGTISQPWKSLEKLNIVNLKPGDKVFFEGGNIFAGTLLLDSLDKGSKNKPIEIGSYGKGRAIINGGTTQAIFADKCSYFTITDLVVEGHGRETGNSSDGIFVTNSNHFNLDSIEVYGFQHSGVHVHICSEVKISHVYAHDNGFAGIHITGTTIYSTNEFDNENIYIGFCIAENNPGDPTVKDNHSGNGILASSVRRGTIEYCEAFNNGWDMPWTGNGPVGIWIWDCKDFIIQNCISHDNKTNAAAKAKDGGGFDLDGGVSGSIIQYCISYNNQGPGYGLFEFGAAKPWENNVLRYNISRNDGILNAGSVAMWKGEGAGIMRNCEIYNNTFYTDTTNGASLDILNNCPGFYFRNNIFVYSKELVYPGQTINTEIFQGNCYWNLSGNIKMSGYADLKAWSDATGAETLGDKFTGFYTDPQFNSPDRINITRPEWVNIKSISGFALKSTSPLIDMGIDMRKYFNLSMGLKDLAGTPTPQNGGFEVGAIENL